MTTEGNKLYIHQVFQAHSEVERSVVTRILKQHGYEQISMYQWEKRDGGKEVGTTTYKQRRQSKGSPKGAVCSREGTEILF
jgi:hypothetical protein